MAVIALPVASSQACLWTGDTRGQEGGDTGTDVCVVCVCGEGGLILLVGTCRALMPCLCTWTHRRLLQGFQCWPAPRPNHAQLSGHT